MIDPTAAVVLWQIGVVGDPLFRRGSYDISVLPVLVERLCRFHPPDHICYVYEAAVYPGMEPLIRTTPLGALTSLAARGGLDAVHSTVSGACRRPRHPTADRIACAGGRGRKPGAAR